MEQQSKDLEIRFNGIKQLYGEAGLKRIINANIMIIGIGGVGSWIAEALARSGVGKLTLVDLDDICLSNINRQIHTLETTVGQSKVKSMKERIALINPTCEVEVIEDFVTKTTIEEILSRPCDYIIDAIDGGRNKAYIVDYCFKKKIPMLTVGEAGGKDDPTEITVGDLNQTVNDMLLRRVRKILRREFNYPRHKRKYGISAVYIPMMRKTGDNKTDGNKLDCHNGLGNSVFVTGSLGFAAASHAIKAIVDNHETH